MCLCSPVYDASGPDSQISQVQQDQQPEPEQPSNLWDSEANSKPLDAVPSPHSLSEASSKPAAQCSFNRPIDDCDNDGRKAGRSGDANQSISEHEEREEETGCNNSLDTRGAGGAQTSDKAAGSEDGLRSVGGPQDGRQTGDESEYKAKGAESHNVEERRKTEPVTQIAAAAQRGDVQQDVDLVDAEEEEGGGGRGKDPLTTLPEGSRTIGGDTEQAEPTASESSTSVQSLLDYQVSPEVSRLVSKTTDFKSQV